MVIFKQPPQLNSSAAIKKIKIFSFLIAALVLFLKINSVALAVKNVSAVYCQELGYEFSIQKDQAGNQTGVCKFPDGQTCLAMAFFRGECGQVHSYCQKEGYILKQENDPQKCNYMAVPCSICVAEDGTEIGEVSAIMDLNLQEEKCGDGRCAMDESYKTCPQDCRPTPTASPTPTPVESGKISFLSWLIMKIKEVIAIIMGMIKK